ncbi:MAG TPA: SUMF1/EgtB/PvdO family nonheme iron enzyme [Thermoanaerobaculia bacterium]|nr:SUMF1/EgtB/PvdO family nonheme iron enzyme [Thermoanaerobaculia bacterium]
MNEVAPASLGDERRSPARAPGVVPIPAGMFDGQTVGPFLLGSTPVTNLQYAPCLAAGRVFEPPWWNDPAFHSPRQPVVGITWNDAVAYCAWLSEAFGGRWRLPTEREWEFAACGGLEAPLTAWGSAIPEGEIPNGPIAAPWDVGRGTPNGFGLLDMGTIVHEWCLDWRESERPDLPPRRASRGGSWRHQVRWSAPSARTSLPPEYRYSDYGFRVLRDAG